jgi:hypothetical protein
MRKPLMMISLARETRDALERLTEQNDFYKTQGYSYEDLYDQLFAAATFIHQVKREILPNLKTIVSSATGTVFTRPSKDTEREGVLKDIAVNAFPSNLSIFSDLVHDLYTKTVEFDKRDHPRDVPVFERRTELKDMGRLLV